MNKKTGYLIVAIAFVLLCVGYFRPLSLSGIANENNRIEIVLTEFEVRDGEPFIDAATYEVTGAEKSSILSILNGLAYRRTAATLFSDGSLSDMGDQLATIYVRDHDELTQILQVTDSGSMTINGRCYRTPYAARFIAEITEIVNTAAVKGDIEATNAEESQGVDTDYGIANLPLGMYLSVKEIKDGVVTLEIDNRSGYEMTYGKHFILEVYKDGEWESVPMLEGVAVHDIECIIPDLQKDEMTINLHALYGELGPGHYRFVQDDMSAEFEIE